MHGSAMQMKPTSYPTNDDEIRRDIRIVKRMAEHNPAAIPSLEIRRLLGFWIDVRCECGHSVTHPIRTLMNNGHRGRLSRIYPRFTCRRCGRKPKTMFLTDEPHGDMFGVPTWKFHLWGNESETIDVID